MCRFSHANQSRLWRLFVVAVYGFELFVVGKTCVHDGYLPCHPLTSIKPCSDSSESEAGLF
jgi:hypothetical protein